MQRCFWQLLQEGVVRKDSLYGGPQVTSFTQTISHHNRTTATPHQHHNRLKLVWCGCGVGVVRAGLSEGCHLWATVYELGDL